MATHARYRPGRCDVTVGVAPVPPAEGSGNQTKA